MTPRQVAGPGNPKKVNMACLDNLNDYLSDDLSFAEWESRQGELESRLTPAPELPFADLPFGQPPARPRRVRPAGSPVRAA